MRLFTWVCILLSIFLILVSLPMVSSIKFDFMATIAGYAGLGAAGCLVFYAFYSPDPKP